ncbi:MAG: hypothetical protein K5829_06980 [Treponema sp.]|nr:hypothetical protein [Treponema sp.]
MKKFISFIIFACAFLFTSCDLLLGLLNPEKSTEVDYSSEEVLEYDISGSYSKNYFIKRNKSDSYQITGGYTGYVISSNSENSIVSSEDYARFVKETSFNEDGFSKWNDTEQISKLNSDFNKAMLSPENRAAISTETVTTNSVTSLTNSVNDTDSFYYIVDTKNYTYNYEDATCEYSGDYCEVWFIDNTDLIGEDDLDFNTLGQTFDSIYELETQVLGSNIYESHSSAYIDPQDKIQILLLDIYGDASTSQTGGTFGYFSPIDLYTNSSLESSSSMSKFKSNESQMIYIDSYFYSMDGTKTESNPNGYDVEKQIISTLAHEFNHLLNHCNKTVKNSDLQLDTWYTEMLSLVTEDMFQEYLDIDDLYSPKGRLNYFDYYYNYGFTAWWYDGDEVYISYANAFAYGAYLIRNHGGLKLLKEIATNNYVNEESITKALETLNETPSDTMKDMGYDTVDFEYTTVEFPLVLINYKISSSDAITLYKEADSDIDGLSFTPINLKIEADKKNYYTPKIYDTDDMPDLYPLGFTIHNISDSSISSFSYYKALDVASSYIEAFFAACESRSSKGELYGKIY